MHHLIFIWRRASTLALFGLLGVVLTACGGAPSAPEGVGEDAETATRTAETAATLATTDDGRFELVDPNGEVAGTQYVELMPRRWPAEMGPPPVLGLGEVVDGDVLLWALRQIGSLAETYLVPAEAPSPLGASKLLTRVTEIDGAFVELDAGGRSGVAPGDVYFVLNQQPLDAPVARLGERVGALLRVETVTETTARARIEHADTAVAVGDLSLFGQTRLEVPTTTGTVLVARFQPEGEAAGTGVPSIIRALPEYLARYGLSNIGVATHDGYLDPATPHAARRAADAAPDSGFGVFVFGRVEGSTLLLNTGTFGDPPHPGNTVGILPGGLPLPIEGSVEALSRQLAPSFIATVLALRGEHATGAYFLESVLRNETLDPDVRFHLREHLALRYDSLDQTVESIRIMGQDVDEARTRGLTHPLLNALSIRAFLDDSGGLVDQGVADTEEFIAVAAGVLPERELGHERLQHARFLSYDGQHDAAQAYAQAVVRDAQAWEDVSLEFSALVELALTQYFQQDPAGARLILAGIEPLEADIEPAELAAVRLLEAEMGLQTDPRTAAAKLAAGLELAASVENLPYRASMYRRAAGVYRELGAPLEGLTALEEATRLYFESTQLGTAAELLIELGITELEYAARTQGAGAQTVILDARENLFLGAELSAVLGASLQAARAFMYAGIVERQLGQSDNAADYYALTVRLARPSAHYRTLFEVHQELGRLASEAGDYEAAQAAQAEALVWAEAGGFEDEVEPIVAPPIR